LSELGGEKLFLVSQELKDHLSKYLIRCFVILILGGMMFFYFKSQYQSVLSIEKDRLNRVANNIEVHLNGHLLALRLLSISPAIQRLDTMVIGDQLTKAQQLLKFRSISLYDRSGRLLAGDSNQLFRSSKNDNASFLQVLDGEPVLFITNQILNPQAAIVLLVPVKSNAGNIVGVLAAENSLQEIGDLVASQKLPAEQYLFVTDHGTRLIYHPNIDKLSMKAESIEEWSRHIFSNEASGVVLQKSSTDGGEKLFMFTTLNNLNWQVVDVLPLDALLLIILKKSFGDMLIFGLLLLCLAMLYHLLLQGYQLQEQMQKVRWERLRLVNQLAAGIAHEIRNPLTAIHGYIQLLIKKNQYPPQKEHLAILFAETERIERLVSEFQMLAKPQTAAVYETVDVGRSIADTVLLMESQAINQSVSLEYIHPTGPCFCYGNAEQLKQVWINLVRNAFEAVLTGGKVRIAVHSTAENIIVTVYDNGCGIPEETLINLGTPFFTTKTGGTGLGLSICFSIIGQHDGKIEVQSDSNQGTTFSVYLPLVP
jgi:signal transduction histidine kinase